MSATTESPIQEYVDRYPQLLPFTTSELDFDYGWIKNLRKVAQKSLEKIYGDYSEFKLKDEDPMDFSDFDAGEFVESSMGPVVYLAVMLIIFLFIIIVGLCWCCTNKCCCCCRSNFKGKKEEDYSRGFSVGGITLSIVMTVWLIAFLIMIFHTFPANDKTIDAINEIQPHLDTSINDLEEYISGTVNQTLFLFAGSFQVLRGKLKDPIDKFSLECIVSIICDPLITEINTQMDTIDTELKAQSVELKEALNDVKKAMTDSKSDVDEILEEQIETVTDALYWFFMIFNVIYCIIFGVVLVGTVLSAFSNGSGLKTSGFIVIRCGIALMFIVGSIVVLQTVVMFVLSGATSQIICPAIRSLAKDDGTTVTPTTSAPSSGDYKPPSFGYILGECRGDESAYIAFQLKQVYDLAKLTELTDIKSKLPTCDPLPDTDLKEKCEELLDEISNQVKHYGDFVHLYAETELGKCYPVSFVIDSTLNLFCDTMISPIASYWFIIQFIPPLFIVMFITAMFFERILS